MQPPRAAKNKKPEKRVRPKPAEGEAETLRVDLGVCPPAACATLALAFGSDAACAAPAQGGKAVQLLRAADIFDFGAAQTASFERCAPSTERQRRTRPCALN